MVRHELLRTGERVERDGTAWRLFEIDDESVAVVAEAPIAGDRSQHAQAAHYRVVEGLWHIVADAEMHERTPRASVPQRADVVLKAVAFRAIVGRDDQRRVVWIRVPPDRGQRVVRRHPDITRTFLTREPADGTAIVERMIRD